MNARSFMGGARSAHAEGLTALLWHVRFIATLWSDNRHMRHLAPLVLVLLALTSCASTQPVKLIAAQRVIIGDETGYNVEYEFSFMSRESVYVRQVGPVGASGHLEHLVRAEHLDFLDSRNGKILASLAITPRIHPSASPPTMDVPPESAFPTAYQSFPWTSSAPLIAAANDVLRRYFRYEPRNSDNLTRLFTTYAVLPHSAGAPDVPAKIALLLSFPHDPATNRYSLHVRTSVLEGRSRSDVYKTASDDAVLRAADRFVGQLVAQMQGVHP